MIKSGLIISESSSNSKDLSFIDSFKLFFRELRKNSFLGYLWLISNALIIFYTIVIVLIGQATSLPTPGRIPDIHGIAFLLLITFSFFLIFLFLSSWFRSFFKDLKEKKTIIKLISIHLIWLIVSLFIPIFIFIGLYIVAYFLWYLISSIFLILFFRDLSVKLIGKYSIESKRTSLIFYLIFWFIGFISFGILFISFQWNTLNLYLQMPLMIFPLFIIILPILGLMIKPKSGNKAPITTYSFLVFIITIINWVRYLNWDQSTITYSYSDAIIDIILVTYTFFTLFKNANKISLKLKNRMYYDQLLLLLIWTRISSMILLLTVSDYELFGFSAAEGTYLASMFLVIVVGFVLGIIWIRKGLTKTEIQSSLSLPEIAGEQITK